MASPPTRTFGFLMFPKFEELDLIGPWEMATMWRDYARGPSCLTISENGGLITCAKGLKTTADVSFADCPALDYLLVPGGFAAFDEMRNARLLAFVRERAATASHVLSVCTGSFILHAAGLLDGRCATTHWKARDDMRKLPGVTVLDDRWVRDGNVWTSAGVSAGMDLALGFIEAIDGAKAAGSVQKNAEYYPDGRVYG
jgi:transcriptional regulator GlxA family with amidase domain